MRNKIIQGLKAATDDRLVEKLLEAYDEAKSNYYLGSNRLGTVEGGRFCEAAFRILQHISTGAFEPIGRQIDSEGTIRQLANIPSGVQPDSVRLHIPRALRVIYDIRNNRDAAHLGDGIDPNVQDATIVIAILDWVLAEFVRLFHQVTADQAHTMITAIVTKSVPIIEDFDGFRKVLNPKLKASDTILVLLYACGRKGATLDELNQWVHPKMLANIRRTLYRLENDKAYIHFNGSHYIITRAGQIYVERSGLQISK